MKIGLIADQHCGYTRGTRDNAQGVNVREQDVLDAASAAVANLEDAGVTAIVDLGDIAHVPAPKKRALLHLVNMINQSKLPWYSANGNHTLQRTKSDLHLYDVLGNLCPKFYGFTESTFVPEIGVYLIPYGTEVDALQNVPKDAIFIGGHFACDDVPFLGEHVSVKDLPDIPTFLGHYHTRKGNVTANRNVEEVTLDGSLGIPASWHREYVPGAWDVQYDGPVYIGATERFAWGEATNPTGVAIFDTEDKLIRFIDHPTREWIDVNSDVERLLGILKSKDFDGKIVRVNIEATIPEYHGLDIKSIRDLAKGALELQVRRVGSAEAFETDTTDTRTYSLLDAWHQHTAKLKPAEMRKVVQNMGSKALSEAGIGE